MSEKKITDKIIATLRDRGFFVVKIYGNAFQTAGLPDIFALKAGRLYALEVKKPGAKVTKLQAKRLQELENAGAIVGAVTSVAEALEICTPTPRT